MKNANDENTDPEKEPPMEDLNKDLEEDVREDDLQEDHENEEFFEDDDEDADDDFDEEVPSRKRMINVSLRTEVFLGLLIPIVFIVGLFAGYVWRGRDTANLAEEFVDIVMNQSPETAAAQPEADSNQPVRRYDVPVDDDPSWGSPDAPITIIEFSDFQCPYCTKWHDEVYGLLVENYGDQIHFVYRDLPLISIHPEAVPAAEAANCAQEQEEFWAYHDLLFSNGSNALNAETYLSYAEELGLDMASFEECVETRRYADEVRGDYEFATNLGIQSTPTFFINGIAVVGAQPYEVFREVIERELAGTNN